MANDKSKLPAEQSWHPARLIPVAGIRGEEEQERRATSALLAVMHAVPEFGRALLADTNAPRGRITTYAEVQLKDSDGKLSIPDGAIVVERGKTRWSTLVEVKTAGNALKAEQVGRYLDMARDHGFDALITISNQITPRATELPVSVDRRKTKRINAYHLSWWRILTEAIIQSRHRGVSDPDQAWILSELIHYLDHPKAGAGGFEDMGKGWTRVRDGARQGTLRSSDAEVQAICARWMQFIDYLALSLSQELGRDVRPLRTRNETSASRTETLVKTLAGSGSLSGGLKIPDAVAPVQVLADLRARQVTVSVVVDAPREGRPAARINWILRQLRDAPAGLVLQVSFAGTRETTSALLDEAREYPQRLLSPSDPKREPRSFTLSLSRPLGLKTGKAKGSFVGDTRAQVLDFYATLVQNLKAWQPRAPRLAREPETNGESPVERDVEATRDWTPPGTTQNPLPPPGGDSASRRDERLWFS